MPALNIRMPDDFKSEASEAAARVGLSLNAFFLVAMRDYLDRRVLRRPLEQLAVVAPKLGRVDWSFFPGRPGKNCLCKSGLPFQRCHGRGVLEEVPVTVT